MMCWGVVAFPVPGCSREQSCCWGQTGGWQRVHSSPASRSPQLTSTPLVSPELLLAGGRAVRQGPAEGLVCSLQQLRTGSPVVGPGEHSWSCPNCTLGCVEAERGRTPCTFLGSSSVFRSGALELPACASALEGLLGAWLRVPWALCSDRAGAEGTVTPRSPVSWSLVCARWFG